MVDMLRAKLEASRIKVKKLEEEINNELVRYKVIDELIAELVMEAAAVEDEAKETTQETSLGV